MCVDNGIVMTGPRSLSQQEQFVKEGDTQAVGLQWRSEDLFQGLAFPEQELDVGGAYICLLSLGSASMSRAQVVLQAQLAVGDWEDSWCATRVQSEARFGGGVTWVRVRMESKFRYKE